MKKLLATLGCALCFTGSLFMFGACGDGGSADLTKVNQQISQLEQQVSSLQSTITALQGQIGTSTGDTTLQAQITAMQTQLTAALGRLTVLENQLGGSETNSFYGLNDTASYVVNGSKIFDVKVTGAYTSELTSPIIYFDFTSYLGETNPFENMAIRISMNIYVPTADKVISPDGAGKLDSYWTTFNSSLLTVGTPFYLFVYSNTNLVAIYDLSFAQKV